jgi:hypothetical protein
VNLASASNGVLLVDAIDARIPDHLMDELWARIDSAARRHGVQVFATIQDAGGAVGPKAIPRPADRDSRGITIRRVEAGREHPQPPTGTLPR